MMLATTKAVVVMLPAATVVAAKPAMVMMSALAVPVAKAVVVMLPAATVIAAKPAMVMMSALAVPAVKAVAVMLPAATVVAAGFVMSRPGTGFVPGATLLPLSAFTAALPVLLMFTRFAGRRGFRSIGSRCRSRVGGEHWGQCDCGHGGQRGE